MTKTIEAKPVREARAEARRMAKKTELTYQQALDKVARDAGAEHWAAFAARHPSSTVGAAEALLEDARAPKRAAASFSTYLRSIVSGEHGASEDRIRSATLIAGAREQEAGTRDDLASAAGGEGDRTRINLWWGALTNMATPPGAVLLIGAASAVGLGPSLEGAQSAFGIADVMQTTVWTAAAMATLFAVCLAIGDQAGMERRRAAAWTITIWLQVAGVAAFLLGGFGLVDGLIERTLGIDPYVAMILGSGAIVAGGPIRRSVHAVMALGAALGAKGEGSSFADAAALSVARKVEGEKRRRDRPPHMPMTPEMARELGAMAKASRNKRGWGTYAAYGAIGLLGVGVVLAFVGVVATLAFGIDARPIGYAALAIVFPFLIVGLFGLTAVFIADLLAIPGDWRGRMARHRLVREQERARRT